MAFKSGFAVIAGRPNTGKSTLLNALVEKKISIISDKPQTTRHTVQAVVNKPRGQIVFVDTPGFHKPKHLYGETLNQKVLNAFKEVDVILFMVDIASGIGRGDEYFSAYLQAVGTPKIMILNKADAVPPGELKKQRALAGKLSKELGVVLMLEISALKKMNLDLLLEKIFELLPEGPKYYPDGMITDQPEARVASEIIREKIIMTTGEEVPHSVIVSVERMEKRQNKDMIDVKAVIYVERESQKGILIGKAGHMLKKIGTASRQEIEALLGSPIFLNLRVKVHKKWRKDEAFIKRME